MRISQRAIALAAFLALTCSAVQAEPNRFMHAVAFALTGRADTELKVIDRANCVFAIGADVFHLNNIHTEAIVIRLMGQDTRAGGQRRWVTVYLHGDLPVYEHENIATEEHTLELQTEDQDQLAYSWQFIYGRYGCESKKSPF
jgi:hypothetical protein